MKLRLLFVAAFAVLSLSGAPAEAYGNAFCEGFEAGFGAGACYGRNFCTAPIAPICPIPRIGEEGYQDGYNRGFVVGLNRQR